MLPKNLSFVDIETTGTSSSSNRIIEIGILRVENGKLKKTFSSLVNPQHHVPLGITALTGISSKDLERAPTFRQIKDDILELLSDSLFIAHNVRFDYSFIKNEFKRHEQSFNAKTFCTVKLSRHLYPRFKKHNLDAIIERFSFMCKNRHRALDDAKILWDFFKKTKKEFTKEVLEKAYHSVLSRPTLPVLISGKILDSLPESPGVYIFYGKEDMPLYVGKSINIRKRVLSHFASDYSSSTELKIAQQIDRIETVETAGELGALLNEATIIKKLQPLYNRKLRNARKLIVLSKKTDKKGFYVTSHATVTEINPDNLGNILAVFRSDRQAKQYLQDLCKEHQLCERLLSIEHTNTACFAYRLGRCKGACVEKENPLLYNTRFLQAFTKTKLKMWPFKSPILIEEKIAQEEKGEAFLIDKWCYLGSISYTENAKKQRLEKDIRFDLDTYKILVSYLYSQNHVQKVKQVSLKTLPFSI